MRRKLLVLLLLVGLVAAACGREEDDPVLGAPGQSEPAGGDATEDACEGATPEATEIGVSADTITIEVMADVGSTLAPGLFQGNHDALEAYADYVNANGGIACRDLEVKLWDSKLNPDESKNGLIDACRNALALVGSNSLFNPDVSPMTGCVDKAGATTGLPDIAALANDINQQCNATTYVVQGVGETCEVTSGERDLRAFTGVTKFYLEQVDGPLHGLYTVPGDLPTTVQSATYLIKAQEQVGVVWDAIRKVGGSDAQADYTPRVQLLKVNRSNFVYGGSNDRAMVNIMKEAKAQGVDTVEVWACSLSCYTRSFIETGGADVEGAYVWMQFLPFEEADHNEALRAYVDAVGANDVDSFGAQAWQAAMLFKEVVDEIVETDGVNGITRARMLEVLEAKVDFTADGWMGDAGKDLRGMSSCMVVLQAEGGEWVRRFPEEPGTLDCDDDNLTTVRLDPAKAAESIQ